MKTSYGNLENLKPYELQALVDFFLYPMDMAQRAKLMQEFPVIYNKLFNKEIVSTIILSTGDKV